MIVKPVWIILILCLASLGVLAKPDDRIAYRHTQISFYGDTLNIDVDPASVVGFNDCLNDESVDAFYQQLERSDYQSLIGAMKRYKEQHQPDDWLYYQLVRKVAQYISPKAENYQRYTLYKWFLLSKSGYDATLCVAGDQILFYVRCEENIYDIPFYHRDGRKYVCLNYHDYGKVDFAKVRFSQIGVHAPEATGSFSYRLTHLPAFSPQDYQEKELAFSYYDVECRLKVKVNEQVKKIFNNYPVTDYGQYFDAPLSAETYQSLIPQLKKNMKDMDVRTGVDYLMRFTRYAFNYQPDMEVYGKQKRMTPEQTLLYDQSDCKDRAALFYCLVKEIYNLPMIAMEFPNHLTIAVKFDKPIGTPVVYNGNMYSVCEPTPQSEDLPIGNLSPEYQQQKFEVAYVYNPR